MQIKCLEDTYYNMMDILKEDCKGETKQWGAYRLTFSVRPGAIEYKDIPELKNVELDKYRKPSVDVCKLEFMGENNV